MSDQRPALLVLDTLADVFAGDEVVRAQARAFIAMLRRLALQCGQANLILAHPSLSGMATGKGTSGSTGWSNSVRSRLYFDYLRNESGAVLDRDLRVLRQMKNNYGATGAEIFMRYVAGRFMPERSHVTDPIMKRATAKEAFLRLLKKYIGQNRPVSHKSGRNYAPAIFEADPDAGGISKAAFSSAMSELLDAEIIYIVIEGPPSHRRYILAVSQLPATLESD